MSAEITNIAEADNLSFIMTNGSQDEHINGLSNGYVELSSSHKSSSKYKDKDKYRDKDHRGSSNHRDKDSSDKHNSSRSKDKYRDKDREREKDREKDKHKSSSHKSSSRDKYKEREKDSNKEKDRNREREKDKHRDRDKEKPKEKSERDYDKRDRDNDRKRKEHKSSNSDKDRKDRDRDRHRSESSRDHKNSKDKHSNSSSSKSRDKDRDKEKHSRDKNLAAIVAIGFGPENDAKGCKECTVVIDNVKVDSSDGYSHVYNYGFPEKDIKMEIDKYGYESKTEFKEEPPILNMSQASSCDYSMSQFRDDEPSFVIKHDMTDESQNNTMDGYNTQIKEESEEDDDDVPLIKRKSVPFEGDSDDDVPLVSRKQIKLEKQYKVKKEKKDKKEKKAERKRKSRDDSTTSPKKKKMKKTAEEVTVKPAMGRKKKENEEENQEVWRWWEEEKRDDGVKWHYLEHKGPVFAPPYDKLPDNINFYYDGKLMKLSTNAEEVASFYAKMLNHDYVTKKVFNDNFFKDWRKSMTSKEKDIIRDLTKCNFKQMHEYFVEKSEQNKNRSKEEKKAIKEKNEELIKEYGYCTIDGHKERIGNFKLEPPGLFRGRGEHPKMGLVKRRVMPEDVSINCSKDSKIPQPPPGHRWKEVRHDNTVTWLASWIENVQGQVKYIMLNPSSKLKGEKDYQKYEVARRLDKQIDKIRATYRDEWKSKEMRIRQRGVALYFIDRLALRAGNEKDEDQADTVGCCSLRVEHVQLHKELNGKENVVVFDFLGKDSIRYYNEVEVEKRVFKNLELFMENKKEGDDLFDRLNTAILNEHLRDIMEGLTAKVFRTYNASITLQNQLDLLTDPDVSIQEKLLAYNRANRAVAVLCNHQRSIPKSHAKSMENLKEKIRQKKEAINEAALELKDLQKQAKRGSVKEKLNADKKATQLEKLKEQLKKLELQETDRDENKTIALGTSKLNYLDPRITVAWCKKYGVPIEKIFNKTQREKFRWAIHMADENYRF